MSEHVRVKDGEIFVGKALPWAAYDENGRLLLKKGAIVGSQRQLEVLLKRGLYRSSLEGQEAPEPHLAQRRASPFELFADMLPRLSGVFSAMVLKQPESRERLLKLCLDVQTLCHEDADAALGAVHLYHGDSYCLTHALHTAILCELVAAHLGYDPAQRLAILAAALTANVSMLKLQDQLQRQQEPLTDAQKAEIETHPQRSAELLAAAGVDDPVWLSAVRQHHEHFDGSGYPDGLKAGEIARESQIVGMADRYSAMVSARAYRQPLLAKAALREFFLGKSTLFDEELSVAFIKELSIFPPGSFVLLKNGETAVVIRRQKESMRPTVSSVLSPRGGPYMHPLRREPNEEQYQIRDTCVPEGSLQFNLSVLWGYA